MRRALLAVLLCTACKDDGQPGEGTPYPGCEGLEHTDPCGTNGICYVWPDSESTVCTPKCVDDTDCPAFQGASVHCVGKTFCEITCKSAADCPDGMVCEVTQSCGWPRD